MRHADWYHFQGVVSAEPLSRLGPVDALAAARPHDVRVVPNESLPRARLKAGVVREKTLVVHVNRTPPVAHELREGEPVVVCLVQAAGVGLHRPKAPLFGQQLGSPHRHGT